MMMSTMMLNAPRSPMSANCSRSSVPCSPKGRVQVYRHEPYAASLITPASPADAAFVCCHQRGVKSPVRVFNTPSPSRSISDAALPTTPSCEYVVMPSGDYATTPVSPSLYAPATPATPAPFLPQTPVWVAFKYGRKPFLASFPVHAGEMVIVEGDRGVDLGIVDDACLMQGGPRPQTILRRASAEDETRHTERNAKEQEAVRTMRTLAVQVECPAHVEDAMFQLDGKKITVIISRSTRSFVDFRRLQRALFDVYRCRIWFAYLDEIQETMSTDVTQPLRRGQRRRSSPSEAGTKKMRHVSATSSAESWVA